MRTNPKSDSQIHREGKTIVLCTLIVDVAAICTDDGSNADIRAFLTAAEVRLPEEFLIEL